MDQFFSSLVLQLWLEAWSPSKKHWCCSKRGKGCEGPNPPAVDAGFGMVWKRVQAGCRLLRSKAHEAVRNCRTTLYLNEMGRDHSAPDLNCDICIGVAKKGLFALILTS